MLIHTYYNQPGGEDVVFEMELEYLRTKGHDVKAIVFSNDELQKLYPWQQAARALWNNDAYRLVRQVVRDFSPSIVHIHNTFPFASPAVIHAVRAERIPLVLTLHNYRLLCVNALFFRSGGVCEDCLGRLPWAGVRNACYRESYTASAVAAATLTVHRWLGTWSEMVDAYVALTEFARMKFVEGGLPEEKVLVKPNPLHPDPGPGSGGSLALYVGRLSPEKGVRTLLDAWKKVDYPLLLLGDGPLAPEVEEAARHGASIEWLGRRSHEEVVQRMKQASFLVFPSEWYEGFPMTIAEAFATGLPVVASHLGAMASLIRHGQTGLHFRPGDADDLAAKVEWLVARPVELARMREAARAEFETSYTMERNYSLLMDIYEQAIGRIR